MMFPPRASIIGFDERRWVVANVATDIGTDTEMEQCPGCELKLRADDWTEQAKHLAAVHPDLVSEGRDE